MFLVPLTHHFYVVDVLGLHLVLLLHILDVSHSYSHKHALKYALAENQSCSHTLVLSHDLHSVSRLHFVHQIVLQNHFHTPRQLSDRTLLRHFLKHQSLLVSILAMSEFSLQCIPFLVFDRDRNAALIHFLVLNVD